MHNKPHTREAKEKMRKAHLGIPQMHNRRLSKIVNGKELFQCGKCKKFFPRESFYKNKRTILGITSECRKCHCETAIASRNPELNKKRKRESEARRRARKVSAKGTISKRAYALLEKLFGSICLACGSIEDLQWDHVVPLSKGGKHCVSNLQRLCRKCNERKQARYADYRTEGQKKWVIKFRRVDDE